MPISKATANKLVAGEFETSEELADFEDKQKRKEIYLIFRLCIALNEDNIKGYI